MYCFTNVIVIEKFAKVPNYLSTTVISKIYGLKTTANKVVLL